jgi:hypothetical protein
MKAVFVFLALALFAGGANADELIAGTWTGMLDQYPVGTQPQYPATYTFTANGSGTSTYSSLSCGGNLSGGGSGGSYRFSEYITTRRATATSGGCIDGMVDISINGDAMNVRWSGSWDGVSYGASGTLFRVGGPRKPNWSPGSWVRGTSVANVTGTCFTNWSCHPAELIMTVPERKLVSTRAQRTKGTCAMNQSDPESCGVCLSNEPQARCEYCVEPRECGDSNLGTRSREVLGCCSAH